MTKRSVSGVVGEVVLATGQLVATLENEVEALRRGDVACLERTRTEKARQFRSYEAKLQALKAQPALRASVAPALKTELEEATRKLQTAIDRNVAQLRAAAEANRRLVDAIARAAVDAVASPGYGPPKARPGYGGGAAGAMTVSRQL